MRIHLAIVAVIVAVLAIAGLTSTDPAATEGLAPESSSPASVSPPDRPPAPAPSSVPDAVLVVDDGKLVEVLDGVAYPPQPGIVGLSGRSHVGTKGNQVVRFPFDASPIPALVEGAVGDRIAMRELVPMVTDRAEEWVAFGSPSPAQPVPDGTIAHGRATSEIMAVSPSGQPIGGVLAGNLVPEAFSTESEDGTAPWLYVLEYLPATAPTHYRVRVLDPNTMTLSLPSSLRDQATKVGTQMAGVSRDQVFATGRGLLFTLYRGHHDDTPHPYAFVHALSTGAGVWCLVVPDELALAETAGAIAVSPDESAMYAVSANGFVAEYAVDDVLDPQRSPDAWRTVRALDGGAARPAVIVTDEHIVVAQGRDISWLARDDLSVVAATTAPGDVDAIAVGPTRDSVMVAVDDRVGVVTMDGDVRLTTVLPAGAHGVTKIVPG